MIQTERHEVIEHLYEGVVIEEHVTYHAGRPAPWLPDVTGKVKSRTFQVRGIGAASSLELMQDLVDQKQGV